VYTIGQLSKTTGCAVETLRYYEKIGIINKPHRSSGGHRLYNKQHEKELRFVLKARQIGFSLSETRKLIELSNDEANTCTEVLDLSRHHLTVIAKKIDQLSALKDEIEALALSCESCCAGKATAPECTIIKAFGSTGAPAVKPAVSVVDS
jgi:MerR family mercuric resistance operon transcriptional regulator